MVGRNLNPDDFERLTIDYHPGVVPSAIDFNFRLTDGNFLTNPTVRLEDMFQLMKPPSDRLM